MTDGRAAFVDAHASLMDALGTDATVQRGSDAAVPVRVVVRDGVSRLGQYGQVVGRNTVVSFLRSQWQPKREDVLTLDGVARKVEAIDEDDGIAVTVVLHG
jgi:hypothetical protein